MSSRRLTFNTTWQVGAVALGASLDCDMFADAHSADSHFDKSSFVGLAVCTRPETGLGLGTLDSCALAYAPWRPSRETICSEAYSTVLTRVLSRMHSGAPLERQSARRPTQQGK